MLARPSILILFAFIATGTLAGCPADDDLYADRVTGDLDEEMARIDVDDLPIQAEAFLATDRPWRAASLMRRYFDNAREVTDDHRVLAARAEAGWGGWPEVLNLLADVSALDTYYNGIGLYLLGRAHDEAGDAAAAVEAYRAFLALSPPAGELEDERHAARLRLGLALAAAGEAGAARRELDASSQHAGDASLWIELLEAHALAQAGDVAAVQGIASRHTTGIPGLFAWRARIEAATQAGDHESAREIANRARDWAGTDATRAEFLVAAARSAFALGDVEPARAALRSAIQRRVDSPHAREAAAMLEEGDMTLADHLAVARVYRAQGLHEQSLEGYRAWLAVAPGTSTLRSNVHMEHAQALFWLERYDDVIDALRPIADETRAQMLAARAEGKRRNFDDGIRLYLGVAENLAGTATGGSALFLAASLAHESGDFDRARELYQRVTSRYDGTNQMGHAMMRLAGLAFLEGEYERAAGIWSSYLERFPRGQRAEEAAYWSARAHAEAGNQARAESLFRNVRQQHRMSYYAVLASERLEEPFWPVSMSPSPADSPSAANQVARWMQGVDLLRNAGFPDMASAEADRVVQRAGNDRLTLYALAEALADRGYSMRAIRIGQRLERTEPRNRRLLRILYPFPYRTLITEESRDRGLDPFVSAALIRQESMFEERITSPAGARGLMQIMPATGARLADAVDLEPWDAELLYHPEINVHLGTRYVAQHSERYDGELPSIFSAYNAGAHRVERWQQYPEHEDTELFTERIPFHETREYVKILTRNRALYQGLYEGEE